MAIALDTSVEGGLVNPGTSLTYSHTCTGSNLILFVAVFGDSFATDVTGNKISGVTYNGTTMTEVTRITEPADRWLYLFYLINPTTGTHNVVVSAASSIAIEAESASYTGVQQNGQPDASATNSASAVLANTDFTTTLTTIADNCWGFLATKTTGTPLAGTGSTLRKNTSAGLGIFDTNGVITPAGSKSMSAKQTNTQNWATIMISFSPDNSTTTSTSTSTTSTSTSTSTTSTSSSTSTTSTSSSTSTTSTSSSTSSSTSTTSTSSSSSTSTTSTSSSTSTSTTSTSTSSSTSTTSTSTSTSSSTTTTSTSSSTSTTSTSSSSSTSTSTTTTSTSSSTSTTSTSTTTTVSLTTSTSTTSTSTSTTSTSTSKSTSTSTTSTSTSSSTTTTLMWPYSFRVDYR